MISRPVPALSPSKSFREPSTPRGKFWVKPTDQMDLWLDSQGYYRKHTAKDGSCLYRAVSEQVFLAQAFHMEVRKQCADYAQRHPELLSSVTGCLKSEYVEQMRHPHEAGGALELNLMSCMYRKDFLVFDEIGKHCQNVTNNSFKDKMMLCLSQDHHYDSVYTKKYIAAAAFCQSLVYETLYKGVFELQEVDYAVKKMLHDKTTKYQRDTSSFLMNGLALRLEIRDSYVNVKELLSIGVTPFPYKVAKSLDPDIYRNVEYDTWNDIRRGLRNGTYFWNNRELQVGVKCLVRLQPNQTYHAHIQEMGTNKGPVLVFVEELGKKLTVAYESLELLPQPPPTPTPTTSLSLPIPLKQLRQLHAFKTLTSASLEDHQLLHNDLTDKNDSRDSSSENTERDLGWRSELEIEGKLTPKLKMFSQLSKGNKKPNKPYRSKLKEQPKPSNDSCSMEVEANSVVSSTDNNYEQQDLSSYQSEHQEFPTPRYIHQELPQPMDEDMLTQRPQELLTAAPLQPTAPPMLCLEQPHYFMDGFPHPPPAAYCFAALPHRLPDNTDYPCTTAAAEVPQPRFYYNYGMDAYGRGIRPTPPCYLNTAVAYVPDPNVNSSVYENGSTPISTPDSAVVMSPVGMYARQRPDSLPVLASPGGVSLNSEPDTTSTPSYHGVNIAPRFKNKFKAMAGRMFDSAQLQQAEVTSTTAPAVAAPPLPTHYLPPPAPVYYHPHSMEYDATYCPTNYIEYGVYDPNTAVFYPPAHTFPAPTHFALHPDTLYYPHVVTAPFPSAV